MAQPQASPTIPAASAFPELRVAGRLLVAAALLTFVLGRVDRAAVFAAMVATPWWAWCVPTVALTLNAGVHALRIRAVLPAPRPPVSEVLRCVLLGNFFGIALPTGGGEAAKAIALARLSGQPEQAVMALLTSRMLELPPWGALLFWAAAKVLPGRLDSWVPVAWAVGAIFWGVFLIAVFAHRYARLLLALPLPPSVRPLLERCLAFRPRLLDVVACGLGAIPFAALNCAVVWALLVASHTPLGYADVLGLIPAMDVVISLPITIGGAGVRETMFCHALAPWGVSAEIALSVSWLRWSGDLSRAALGGVWWGVRRDPGGLLR